MFVIFLDSPIWYSYNFALILVNMATEIPTPLLVVLLAALESIVGIYAVPQYLPSSPFNWLLIRLALVQVSLWAIWAVLIHPFFFSPFLDLPRPKVPSMYNR